MSRSTENWSRDHELRKQAQATAGLRKDAQESGKADAWRSRVAIGISVAALVMSAAGYRLAFGDDEGDRQWRREQQRAAELQVELLKQIRDELKKRQTP